MIRGKIVQNIESLCMIHHFICNHQWFLHFQMEIFMAHFRLITNIWLFSTFLLRRLILIRIGLDYVICAIFGWSRNGRMTANHRHKKGVKHSELWFEAYSSSGFWYPTGDVFTLSIVHNHNWQDLAENSFVTSFDEIIFIDSVRK